MMFDQRLRKNRSYLSGRTFAGLLLILGTFVAIMALLAVSSSAGARGNGAADFAALCIVSEVKIAEGPESKITAAKSSHSKCERCWNYWPSVGTDSTYGDVCERCANVVRSVQA